MPSFDVSESVSLPVPASTRRSSPRALGVRVWTYWPWFVVTAALCYGIAIPMHRGFNVYLTVVWSLAFPITVLALWGLVASRRLVPSPWGPPARDLLIIQIPTIWSTRYAAGASSRRHVDTPLRTRALSPLATRHRYRGNSRSARDSPRTLRGTVADSSCRHPDVVSVPARIAIQSASQCVRAR